MYPSPLGLRPPNGKTHLRVAQQTDSERCADLSLNASRLTDGTTVSGGDILRAHDVPRGRPPPFLRDPACRRSAPASASFSRRATSASDVFGGGRATCAGATHEPLPPAVSAADSRPPAPDGRSSVMLWGIFFTIYVVAHATGTHAARTAAKIGGLRMQIRSSGSRSRNEGFADCSGGADGGCRLPRRQPHG